MVCKKPSHISSMLNSIHHQVFIIVNKTGIYTMLTPVAPMVAYGPRVMSFSSSLFFSSAILCNIYTMHVICHFVTANVNITNTRRTCVESSCNERPPSVLKPHGQNIFVVFYNKCYLWFKATCLFVATSIVQEGWTLKTGLTVQVGKLITYCIYI